MIRTLLLCAMVLQASAQTSSKPLIDNDRVVVWDVTDSANAQPFDAVVVSLNGNATFLPRGVTPKIVGRSIIIDLKAPPVGSLKNETGYPLAFPRDGSKKILENGRVIVWDNTWRPGVDTPVHFHDKDVVLVYLDDGDIRSTTPDGQVTVNHDEFGTTKFTPRNRTHTEKLIRGKLRAIITELK